MPTDRELEMERQQDAAMGRGSPEPSASDVAACYRAAEAAFYGVDISGTTTREAGTMTLTITIDLGSAAFEDYSDEPQRILRDAADRLDSLGTNHAAGELFTLFDVNGNTVGHVDLVASRLGEVARG